MKRIELNNDVFIIEHFMDEAACIDCIQWSEQMGYEEAKVNIHGQQVMMKNIRDNKRLLITNVEMAQQMYERILPFIPQTIGLADACGLNELFRFYKYEPGEKFKRHRDGSYQRNEKEFSLLTLLIYLNEDFEGGATSFSDAIYQPKIGTAMVFTHAVLHQGDEVLKGIKYVLRTDIMYKLP
jgi:prolyl 4-hydroxylase